MLNSKQNNKPSDNNLAQMEVLIGKIMRIGVTLAIVAMLIGLILMFFRPTAANAAYPTRLNLIWQGVWQGQPLAWMMFGLLLLIFTPVLRVVVSIIAFLKIKDYLYVAITSLVLIILCIAILYGYYSH